MQIRLSLERLVAIGITCCFAAIGTGCKHNAAVPVKAIYGTAFRIQRLRRTSDYHPNLASIRAYVSELSCIKNVLGMDARPEDHIAVSITESGPTVICRIDVDSITSAQLRQLDRSESELSISLQKWLQEDEIEWSTRNQVAMVAGRSIRLEREAGPGAMSRVVVGFETCGGSANPGSYAEKAYQYDKVFSGGRVSTIVLTAKCPVLPTKGTVWRNIDAAGTDPDTIYVLVLQVGAARELKWVATQAMTVVK